MNSYLGKEDLEFMIYCLYLLGARVTGMHFVWFYAGWDGSETLCLWCKHPSLHEYVLRSL